MYIGGTPLFNESTGQSTDRYSYLKTKFPELPWVATQQKGETSKNPNKKQSILNELTLLIGNTAVFIMWFRVFSVFVSNSFLDMDENVCNAVLRPRIIQALIVSGIELLNAILGLTRSKPHQVLLFASVRTGVEMLAAPQLPCNAMPHLITTLCWSLDSIRFACFGLDALFNVLGFGAVHIVKSVRYTVGPLIFPLGATGEMIMVLSIAMKTGRYSIYFAASLWPLGFYPLMKSLLFARKKHFKRLRDDQKKKHQ